MRLLAREKVTGTLPCAKHRSGPVGRRRRHLDPPRTLLNSMSKNAPSAPKIEGAEGVVHPIVSIGIFRRIGTIPTPTSCDYARGRQRIADGLERRVRPGADLGDGCQADDHDQRQHHGVLDRCRAVFGNEETLHFLQRATSSAFLLYSGGPLSTSVKAIKWRDPPEPTCAGDLGHLADLRNRQWPERVLRHPCQSTKSPLPRPTPNTSSFRQPGCPPGRNPTGPRLCALTLRLVCLCRE